MLVVNEKRSSHTLYKIFSAMLQRCYNPNNKNFLDYGGRGIVICQEWIDDFNLFFDWAINNGYQRGKTIDRIDNNGIYSPDNCRFTNKHNSIRNRRNTIFIEFKGEKKPLSEWSAILDIPYAQLVYRLRTRKLPVSIAFNKEYVLKRKFIVSDEGKSIGEAVKKHIKGSGRKNLWIVKKMQESGFEITDSIFSDKIHGLRNRFDQEEYEFIFNLF